MNTGQKVVIVDYGMGNLHSVKRKIDVFKLNTIISNHSEDLLNADKIILPGVGHFGRAMENLKQLGLIDILNQAVMDKQTPILGICLGMQLMAKYSEEGSVEGLGWFDAEVLRFQINDSLHYKVPHTGWNQIELMKSDSLMKGIENGSEMYFVHSYHFKAKDQKDILAETVYEQRFVSAVQRENLYGVQFHPEKSHEIGEKLISNFLML